jgi:hypothetical protein
MGTYSIVRDIRWNQRDSRPDRSELVLFERH